MKITVLKIFHPSEVFKTSPVWNKEGPCEFFKVGQEFIVDESGNIPEGFGCNGAFYDNRIHIETLGFGGDFPWSKEKGVAVTCCMDGLRPVIFKLERI